MPKYVPATREAKAFNCPFCGAYAVQLRRSVVFGDAIDPDFEQSDCLNCRRTLLWHREQIVFPATSVAPQPHELMPEEVLTDFEEARNVFGASARSSAALLRLAAQKLCVELGLAGKNLNDDIADLVKRGLPTQVKQAFDVVRVIGNNQVHPGVLDVRDDRDIAISLFDLLNLIVEVMIAQPARVKELYAKLPESSRKAIEQRDAAASGSGSP